MVAVTPFAARGAVTDEYAFRTLWTEAMPRLDGDWVKFGEIRFEPKPVQQPHPADLGRLRERAGVARAARLGDAWYPIGSNNRHLLDTLPRYRAGIERLRRFTAEAGRDPATVALTYRVKRYGEAVPDRASDGERRLFSGGLPTSSAICGNCAISASARSTSTSNARTPTPRSPRFAASGNR